MLKSGSMCTSLGLVGLQLATGCYGSEIAFCVEACKRTMYLTLLCGTVVMRLASRVQQLLLLGRGSAVCALAYITCARHVTLCYIHPRHKCCRCRQLIQ